MSEGDAFKEKSFSLPWRPNLLDQLQQELNANVEHVKVDNVIGSYYTECLNFCAFVFS